MKTGAPALWGRESRLSADPEVEILRDVSKVPCPINIAVKLMFRGPAGCIPRNSSVFIGKVLPLLNKNF